MNNVTILNATWLVIVDGFPYHVIVYTNEDGTKHYVKDLAYCTETRFTPGNITSRDEALAAVTKYIEGK